MEHFTTPILASRSVEMESGHRCVMDTGRESVKVKVMMSTAGYARKSASHFQGISRFQPPEVQVSSLFRSTNHLNCLRNRDWFVVYVMCV